MKKETGPSANGASSPSFPPEFDLRDELLWWCKMYAQHPFDDNTCWADVVFSPVVATPTWNHALDVLQELHGPASRPKGSDGAKGTVIDFAAGTYDGLPVPKLKERALAAMFDVILDGEKIDLWRMTGSETSHFRSYRGTGVGNILSRIVFLTHNRIKALEPGTHIGVYFKNKLEIKAYEQPAIDQESLERRVDAFMSQLGAPTPNLKPHQALLLSFIEALSTPEKLYCEALLKHRDLYYREALGYKLLPAQPDKVLVAFEPEDDVESVSLRQGELLDAGTDANGEARNYVLDTDVDVTAARLAQALLCVSGDSTRLRTAYTLYQDGDRELDWPLEGVELKENSISSGLAKRRRILSTARIVPARCLHSSGGIRTIKVVFSGEYREPLTLSASTRQGWRDIGQINLDRQTHSGDLTLTSDFPPIVANAGLEALNNDVPLLRIASDSGLEIPSVVSITMTVRNAPLMYSTIEGVMDPRKPSFPFSAQPHPRNGSRFHVMCRDWAALGGLHVKPLLSMEWMPDTPTLELDGEWWASIPGEQVEVSHSSAIPHLNRRPGIYETSIRFPLTVPPGLKITDDDPALSNLAYGIELHHAALPGHEGVLATPMLPFQLRRLSLDYVCEESLGGSQYTNSVIGILPAESPSHSAEGSGGSASANSDTHTHLYFAFSVPPSQTSLSLYWDADDQEDLESNWQILNGKARWEPCAFVSNSNCPRSGKLTFKPQEDGPFAKAAWVWVRKKMGANTDGGRFKRLVINGAIASSCSRTASETLPANEIFASRRPVKGLRGIKQPAPSFGGRDAEDVDAMIKRVPAELQEQKRLLTHAEIETFIKQRYPDVEAVSVIKRGEGKFELSISPANNNLHAIRDEVSRRTPQWMTIEAAPEKTSSSAGLRPL